MERLCVVLSKHGGNILVLLADPEARDGLLDLLEVETGDKGMWRSTGDWRNGVMLLALIVIWGFKVGSKLLGVASSQLVVVQVETLGFLLNF